MAELLAENQRRQKQARIQDYFSRRTTLDEAGERKEGQPPSPIQGVRTLPEAGKAASNCPGPPSVGGEKVGNKEGRKRTCKVLERWSHILDQKPGSPTKKEPGMRGKEDKGRRTKEGRM